MDVHPEVINAYCREISSWIDPVAVLDVIDRLHKNRDAALAPSGCVLVSNELLAGEDAGFASLVRLYLEHFRFPAAYLDLLAHDPMLPEARPWFEALRFEGSISLDVALENPPRPDARGLIVVRERDAVADLLMHPLNMLLNIVTAFARTWRNPPSRDVYLLHSSTGMFHTFVERVVAESYGFAGAGAGGVVATFHPERALGSLTFSVDSLPLEDGAITILRSAAIDASRWGE